MFSPVFPIGFRPAFHREKEILRDLAAGVLHPVTHFHRREFLVQIDHQLFVLDRHVRRRFWSEAAPLPVTGTPVCHAPPLASSRVCARRSKEAVGNEKAYRDHDGGAYRKMARTNKGDVRSAPSGVFPFNVEACQRHARC